MSNWLRISIITPNFNGARYLEETILSVITQNYPNLEYIIIDGGSTDGSVEIIKKYEKHLAYWVSEPDNGLYHAVQKGFEKSTGEIMGWINSDDMYHPKSFFSIAEIFTSFSCIKWITTGFTHFDEFGRCVSISEAKRWIKYDFYLFNYKWIQQESTFWKRELWEKVGKNLNVNLKYAGDLELWLRFFRYEELYVTTAIIGGFRLRGANQISLDFYEEYCNEAEECIKNEKLSIEDTIVLKEYYKAIKMTEFLKKFRIIKSDKPLFIFKKKYLKYPKRVLFNRFSQKFELYD